VPGSRELDGTPRTFLSVGWTAADLPDLTGHTAVVTGANSGIGLVTARELAAHGADVVLACRDVAAGEQAAGTIGGPGRARVAHLDLASSAAVRAFGDAWDGPLDLLVNNAGVMAPPRRAFTVDGFELQFGTNHLGHFVLTGLLLPVLAASGRGRVVTVASIAHHGGSDSVLDGNVGEPYNARQTYADAKLANLLFALELHRELVAHELPVVSTAAHPGVAATGLVADPEGMGRNRFIRVAGPIALRLFTQSPRSAARAVLYAATVAEPGSYTGPQWLGETRGPIGPAKLSAPAQDEKLARRLWQVSEELTGLRYDWSP
jgi:NAD(P)-dependent dehydrogenase (short-subunit alcohol dehydrogenase family)